MSRVRISAKQKNQVIDRLKGCCEFCRAQLQYSPNSFHVEPMPCLIQAIVRKDKISDGSHDDRA
jgi:hypothetical protein